MREAACSCGQLRLEVEGDPVRVGVCHCLACQRRSGAPFAQQARFPRERVTISGEARDYVRYSDEDGAPRTFSFCPECGSTVYYRNHTEPGVIAIAVGAFADPSFPPPQYSVWEERKHPWVTLPDGIERPD
ncbi:MAG TPA: GFA family protein [Solirubrobacteraceae bacterium]|nr:GFA family protein [Solirubrobacteraceae bacterium]